MSSIVKAAFYECTNLRQIILPEGIVKIVAKTFMSCERLKKVYIPNSVTIIEACAFSGCETLSQVYYSGSETAWNDISINQDPSGDYFEPHDANEPLTDANISYNSNRIIAAAAAV